ncbi:MAG: LD-carboxypeptidase [Bacteroidales bacterium]|nr:LD-carboxypeptidase [Bacteroidales bacterium]
MIRPPYLNNGDHVGIVAPAGIVSKSDIEPATGILQDWGLKIIKGRYLFEKKGFFAGTDRQRLEDFQNMLDNPDIRAIFCARGGYGIIRILEKLDFNRFIKSPKWIIGYSDITLFHIYLNHYLKCESLHALMPRNFEKARQEGSSLPTLRKALFGELLNYNIKQNRLNKPGNASGKITGGNLSIIYSLQGTPYEIKTKNKILFIEDIGENIYHIDRMMMNLQISGKLKDLKGLIVGGMTRIKHTTPDFDKSAYDVISEIISEYSYPVIYGFPAGHLITNHTLVMGRNIRMEVSDHESLVGFTK